MKKVCVVTATRAEYGLLRNIIELIHLDNDLELCLIVTGTHLSDDFGRTVSEIEADEYPITEKIDVLLNSDSRQAVSKTMGLAFISFADMFAREKPDMLIVLGDRYELLSICGCAMNARIPIAHISGGETTEGAIDECIRHCITKMSYLHFPGCEDYRKRIIQLGESPDRVFNFGDVGVENINKCQLMSREVLEADLNFNLNNVYMSVTFHPVTLDEDSAEEQMKQLLTAITAFPNINFVFTKANADAGGKTINRILDEFIPNNPNCIAFESLGLIRYLSLLKYSGGVVGNSSSGIVEAPSFNIPTINIGDRQSGRLQASSIINCEPKSEEIIKAINLAISPEFKKIARNTINPYGEGDTAYNIVDTIKYFIFNKEINLKKQFYDL